MFLIIFPTTLISLIQTTFLIYNFILRELRESQCSDIVTHSNLLIGFIVI